VVVQINDFINTNVDPLEKNIFKGFRGGIPEKMGKFVLKSPLM
jgi:hypothetical protein